MITASTHKVDHQGFTLIEVLVALTLTSLMFLLIFLSHNSIFTAINNARREITATGTVTLAFDRIASDLALLPFMSKEALEGENEILEGQQADSFHFPSLAHLDYDNKAVGEIPAHIKYSIQKIKGRPGFCLMRHDQPWPDLTDNDGSKAILCDNIYSFTVRYFDYDSTEWHHWPPSSFTTNENGPLWPLMLKITLVLADNNGEKGKIFSTNIFPTTNHVLAKSLQK